MSEWLGGLVFLLLVALVGGYLWLAFCALCFSGGTSAPWPMNHLNEGKRVDSWGRDWDKYPEDPYE